MYVYIYIYTDIHIFRYVYHSFSHNLTTSNTRSEVLFKTIESEILTRGPMRFKSQVFLIHLFFNPRFILYTNTGFFYRFCVSNVGLFSYVSECVYSSFSAHTQVWCLKMQHNLLER